mgnify:CR=1 FL=1|tara:strand:+ start:126 stop:662 length:537 start_codon:yes stop_codon:yes gene_type:complete
MNIRRRLQPGMRVKKFHNGGKGPGHPHMDEEKLKRGVSAVESASGTLMMNPHSTATGLYGQLYSEIDQELYMDNVSREEFRDSIPLQEDVWEKRMSGDISGVPGLRKNAQDLTDEYSGQLGDKWNYSPDEVAAISNFLGRQGARNYFAAVRDNKKYTPPGMNKTVEQYLKEYREATNE